MTPQDIFKKLKAMFDNPWKAEQEVEVLNTFLDALGPFEPAQLEQAHFSVMAAWKSQTPPKPAHYLDHLRNQSNIRVSELRFVSQSKFQEWWEKQTAATKITYIEQVRSNDIERMKRVARDADASSEIYYQNRIAKADRALADLKGENQVALFQQ